MRAGQLPPPRPNVNTKYIRSSIIFLPILRLETAFHLLIVHPRTSIQEIAHYFIQRWLPESGYKTAGINGFEIFTGDPAATSYFQLQRQIHIPIEPVMDPSLH